MSRKKIPLDRTESLMHAMPPRITRNSDRPRASNRTDDANRVLDLGKRTWHLVVNHGGPNEPLERIGGDTVTGSGLDFERTGGQGEYWRRSQPL